MFAITQRVALAPRAPAAFNSNLFSIKRCPAKLRVVHSQSPRNDQNGRLENTELLIGDILLEFSFLCYKQIAAITLTPDFPGWLAPLKFNPLRFEEFFSLVITVCGTWFASGLLFGAYTTKASATIPSALTAVSKTWTCCMVVAAAQLVLVTAAEDKALVGTEGWGIVLPLAATGPGEPFITAAQILGLMAIWRSFYAAYLDISKFMSFEGARLDKQIEEQHFRESLLAAIGLAVVSSIALHLLSIGLFSDSDIILLNF